MGEINCLEYYAIAHVAEQTGKNPALNKLGPRPILSNAGKRGASRSGG
jgi:hypothetical protein